MANQGGENYRVYVIVAVVCSVVLFFSFVVLYSCLYGVKPNSNTHNDSNDSRENQISEEDKKKLEKVHDEGLQTLSSRKISTKTDEQVTEIIENVIESNQNNLSYFDEEKYDQEKINVYKTKTAKFLTHLIKGGMDQ